MRPDELSLTVAVPTKNAARTIGITLAHLQSLRARGAKVILADSYSTDGTLEVARSQVDEVIDVPPGNLYRAVNAALAPAKSDWLTYINGDDYLFPIRVLQALNPAESSAEVIYGNLDFVDDAGAFLHSWTSPEPADLVPLFSRCFMPIPQAGTLFRRKLFHAIGGFDEGFKYSADFDFFLRAAIQGHQFQRVPRTLAAFRVHSTQISNRFQSDMLQEASRSVSRAKLSGANAGNAVSLVRLRARNWHNYLIRVLRARTIAGHFAVTKTLQPLDRDPSQHAS